MKVLLAFLSCLVMVNAQFTPKQPPQCVAADVQAGKAYHAHERFCQLFRQCNLITSFVQLCNTGMLFNAKANRCASPTETHIDKTGFCENWQCNGQMFPDTCCNKYWTCSTASGQNIWTQNACNVNEKFNMAQGRCEQTSQSNCINDARCVDPSHVYTDKKPCQLSAIVNEPCKYLVNDGGIKMPCAAGTEFNPDVCGCDHSTKPDCNPQTLGLNKDLGLECKASYRTNFANGAYDARSDKINMAWSNAIKATAVNIVNGAVIFPGTLNNKSPELFVYYYTNNQFIAPVVFTITFAFTANQNQQQNIQLITNGLPTWCEKTLSVEAVTTFSGVSFNIYVKEDTVGADKEDTFTVQTNFRGVNTNWIKLNLAYTGRKMVAEVFDLGNSNSVPQTGSQGRVSGTPIGSGSSNLEFGSFMKVGNCGLTLGKNLNGKIREFAVYEGCQLADQRNPVKFFSNYQTLISG